MKEINVSLHPAQNGGEGATAKVIFFRRAMQLELKTQAYGSHWSSTTINFDSPEDMLSLANALTSVAYEAKEHFKNNP